MGFGLLHFKKDPSDHQILRPAYGTPKNQLQADLRKMPGPHTTAPKWEVHIAFLEGCQLEFSLRPCSIVTSFPSPKSFE